VTNKSRKQPRSRLAEWATLAKKRIAILASLAAFVLSIIGGFVQPIADSSERRGALLSLSPFLVTVLAGLIFFASQHWGHKAQSKKWFLICITSLILSIGSLLAYGYLIYDRTCVYDTQRRIVGTVLTSKGHSYVTQNPNKTCDEILADFVGEVEAVWTKESINRSILALESSYITCISLFGICLLALGQAVSGKDDPKSSPDDQRLH